MVPVLKRELRLGRMVDEFPWIPETDDAVDGRLPGLGGWGNEAMLIVRRRDFSGLPGGGPPEVDRVALRLEVEFDVESGDFGCDKDGDFRDCLGLTVRNLRGEAVLGRGVAGLEEFTGREGCGNVDMEAMTKIDKFRKKTRPCGRIGER